MSTRNIVLVVAVILIVYGLTKPNINNVIPNPVQPIVIEVVPAPTDPAIKEAANKVVASLTDGSNDRIVDGKRLCGLYWDIATLIELDGNDTVIKTTEEVRQANALSGSMLRMNIKDKYPDLAKSANSVIVVAIGDDNIILTKELRAKAVEGFRALSWACDEGSK
jgi:hypothetical protein